MLKDNKNLFDRRTLSYLINQWDDINLPHTEDYSNVVEQVVTFFQKQSELVYPAKSYFVAIVYSKCLEVYFQIPFFQSLIWKDLLPDDKYFKTYEEDKETYDQILQIIGKNILSYPSTNKTIYYFKKEFLVTSLDKVNLP